MTEPERVEEGEPHELDDYAIRIVTGKVDIRIYASGEIEGWPPGWKDGAQFLLFNRIPALNAAAEQIGVDRGYMEAEKDLAVKPTIISQPLPK